VQADQPAFSSRATAIPRLPAEVGVERTASQQIILEVGGPDVPMAASHAENVAENSKIKGRCAGAPESVFQSEFRFRVPLARLLSDLPWD
jgi:hypothetical protein